MKKILFKVAVAIGIISSINTSYAQCGTAIVGTSNYVQYSSLSDMAIAPDNKIYTFAYNSSAMQFQLHAAYAASSWSLVATLSGSTSVKPDIAVSKTGKVSVFLRDNLDGSRGKVYTLSGSTFTAIGTAISTSSVSNLSLAFNLAGNECIAYTDISNSNKSTVKQWNGTSSWDNVGAGTVSTGGGFFNSLLVDKNDKYVLAFQDANSGNKTNVCRYNAGVWTSLGMIGSTANNCKLKEATNGDYYLGFTETANNAQIHKYNGSVWSQVGATISSISSTANNFDLELDAVDSPYLLAVTTSTPDIVFYRYSFSSWSMVTSFSNTSSNVLALSIDNKGLPFMFHVDVPSNAGLNVKQLVSMVNLTTQPTSTTVCVGQSPTFLVSTMGGSPFFQWQQAQFGEFSNIPGATSSSYSTPPANPGMNQYKYRCVVNSGCSNIISNSGTLTVTSLNINTTSTNPTCSGGTNGVISSTVTGGTGPYNYNWTPVGGTTSTASFLTAGSYTLNVVDANTCATSTVVNLTSPPSISSTFSGNMTICNGSNTSLTITATGGTGALTYSWSPGASLSTTTGSVVTANPSSAETYNVQATDVLGCIATTTVMVDFYANQPTITANSSSGTICNGSNVTLTSSGINVDTYVWNPGGLSGSSQNVTPSSSTVYTVTGTNTVTGCSASTTVAINVNSLPTANAGTTRTLTCVNTSTTLTGSAVGAISYNWSGPGIVAGATTLSPTINLPGTYSFVSMSAAGCVSPTSTVAVTQNTTSPSPTASTTGTLTCSTLTVALNGTPGTGVAYQWTGPGFSGGTTSQNAVANAAGSFTLRVTNSINGCTNTAVTNVTQNTTPPNPNATASGTISCITTTVSLNALPASGVTYTWTGPGSISGPNTQTPVVNAGGTYTLSITSLSNGCSNTFPLTVNSNTVSPTVIPTMSGSLTCVTNTITAYVTTTTTPVTYNWTGTGILTGATTATITTNTTGIKNYLVTNTINGCSTYSNVVVVQNTVSPTLSTSNGAINCYTSTTTAGVGTAASPVTYTWSGAGIISASNISTITVNQGGTYGYSVTNTANGCVTSNTLSVATNTVAPSVTSSVSNTISCLTPTTNAIVTTTASPVTYTWSGTGIVSGAPTASLVVNTAGIKSYTVTTTTNGCSSSGTVNVIQNTTPPTATASNSSTLTCTTTTASLFGNGGGTYNWSGPGILTGSTTASPIINLPGCYNLTVTAANGCIATATTCVTQNIGIPTVSGGVSGTLTCVNPTVNATSSTTTTPVSYNWSGTGITGGAGTSTITVNQSGIFSYTVTNTSNGCNSTGTRVVSQNTVSPSGVNAGMDQNITCNTPSVNLSGSVSSPTNASFNWTGGVCGSPTSSITSACSPNMYTLTVTDPINGCNGTDIMQVTANVTIPTITLTSNSATITCTSPTVSISSSTTVTPVSYSWSPASGIVGGSGSTNTPYFNAPGSYSLVVTDLINGCSTNISSNVVNVLQNIFIPSITISASPSIICSGNSSTLTAFAGSDTDYNWLPVSLNGATQTVTPVTSTLYTVVATNTITGCANSETITLTVNTTPTLSVAGNTTICNGSSSTLTGSGATSYTWNSGANTTTISVTPSITTTYTLIGDNGNGCSSSLPITVSIIPNKAINGIITSTTGATNGDVTLYKYTVGLSHWDSVTTVPFTSSYSFANIDSGLYVIRAIPTATNIQVTYADSAISWQGATIITHGCTNNTAQNIKLITLENFIIGPGVLTGTIVEAFGYVPRMSDENKSLFPGSPIGGIVVKGGKNPGGQMFVQTITDAAGQYTLTGLPLNTGTESYFVFVDIPGLDTNGTYHVVITSTNTVHNGLNFNADAMYINPTGSNTSIITENSLLDNSIYVFPNPAKEVVNIKYELTESADVSIELFNVIGEKIMQVSQPSLQNKNKYQHSINMENINSGIYFIKIKVNSSEKVIKLIKTQ